MNKFIVFKILTLPNPVGTKVQLQDIENRYKEDKMSFELWKTLNPNYSDIHKVYVSGITDDTLKLERVLEFDKFLEFAEKYDSKVIWVGWNCLQFDQPHILFNIQKNNLTPDITNLFTMARFRLKPVFDMMQVLYNWNYPNSLILTADSMGLAVPDILLDRSIFEDEEIPIEKKEEHLQETGKLMTQLFLKIKKYYF